MEKLVSIIIPTYNRAHTLPETLESILAQTYPTWECLIIDDCSTDKTIQTIKPFLKNEKFIYIRRPKENTKGAASCRNIGLKMAKGDYIQFLDSDDLIPENKLEIQVKALNSESNLTIATCKWGRQEVGWNEPTIHQKLPSYFTTNNPIKLLDIFGKHFTYFPIHVFLFHIDLIKIAGPWNEELSLSDDAEFSTRMILNSNKITFCPNTYVIYKTGAGNRLNAASDKKARRNYIKAWNLIENHIKRKTGKSNHIFVRQAKRYFFQRIKSTDLELIKSRPDFFESKMRLSEFYYWKILNKLRNG